MQAAEENRPEVPAETRVVGTLLGNWLYYRSSIFYKTMKGTCPHDGLTVAEAIYNGSHCIYLLRLLRPVTDLSCAPVLQA